MEIILGGLDPHTHTIINSVWIKCREGITPIIVMVITVSIRSQNQIKLEYKTLLTFPQMSLTRYFRKVFSGLYIQPDSFRMRQNRHSGNRGRRSTLFQAWPV